MELSCCSVRQQCEAMFVQGSCRLLLSLTGTVFHFCQEGIHIGMTCEVEFKHSQSKVQGGREQGKLAGTDGPLYLL